MVCTESTTSSVGPDLLDVGEHRAEVGLGGEVELVVDAVGAVGAQPHLGGGLLAGDVEDARRRYARRSGRRPRAAACSCRRPGSPASRIAAPGHQAAAEDAVELGDPAGAEARLLDRDLADRDRRGASPGLRVCAASAGGRLGDRAPGLALAAAADPLGRSPSRTRCSGRRCGSCRGLGHGSNARRAPPTARGSRSEGSTPGSTTRMRVWNDPRDPAWDDPEHGGSHGSGRPTCRQHREPPARDPAHPGRRRRAGRRLPPDGLQRRQQPRPAARGHPATGSSEAIDGARLPAQPRRPQPAHPRLAPDRAAHQPGRRRAPPTPPWTASSTRWSRPPGRPATTCCCSPATAPHRPARGLRRPAALHRSGRVRGHRHLPRQPAGGLARRARARRSWPSAGPGTTRGARHPWVDVDGAAGTATGHRAPARARPRADRLDRLAQGLAASARTGARAGAGRCASAGCPRPGWPPGSRTPSASGREASAGAARRGPAHGVRLRLGHPGHGRAAHPGRARAARRVATSPWSASTTPRSPRSCRPA